MICHPRRARTDSTAFAATDRRRTPCAGLRQQPFFTGLTALGRLAASRDGDGRSAAHGDNPACALRPQPPIPERLSARKDPPPSKHKARSADTARDGVISRARQGIVRPMA